MDFWRAPEFHVDRLGALFGPSRLFRGIVVGVVVWAGRRVGIACVAGPTQLWLVERESGDWRTEVPRTEVLRTEVRVSVWSPSLIATVTRVRVSVLRVQSW